MKPRAGVTTYNHVPLKTVEDWLIVCACNTHTLNESILKQLVPKVFVVPDETIHKVPAYVYLMSTMSQCAV